MQIVIVESDARNRAIVRSRVTEGLRQAEIRKAELIDCRPDALTALALEGASGVLLGPGCYGSLEQLVEKVRSFAPHLPLAAALTPEEYERDAVALYKKLSVQLFNSEEFTQIAGFLIECENQRILARSTKNKNVIGVCHFKGGVGATTLAVALAGVWARYERRVALIDLDDVNPHLTAWGRVGVAKRGAVAEHLALGQVPESRVPDIVSSIESFDGRLGVVGQPEAYNEAFHFKANVLDNAPSSSEFIHSLISALKLHYDLVVIDMGRSWGLATFASLPRCERVVLVTDEDRHSVRRSLECLRRLRKESDDPDEFDLSRWVIALNAYTGDFVTTEALRKQLMETDMFPSTTPIFTVPYSATGRQWGAPQTTFFDVADGKAQTALRKMAYALSPFRSETTTTGEHEKGTVRQLLARYLRKR